MNDTGRNGIRVLVGGYLAYIGVKLISDSYLSRPDHYIIFIILGILFAALGTGYAIFGAVNVIRLIKEDPVEEPEEEEQEKSAEEETAEEADTLLEEQKEAHDSEQ